MDINIKDTIVLSDGNRYVIISKVNYENNVYYYLIDENNNENMKFCVEKAENSSLIEIEDTDLIQQLLPLFLKVTTGVITKEDLEFLEQQS